ncbi:MAG: hypothetical protein KF819_12025 [Labilithrix sp.]|nr:hypothetical protein [Labilithrix sp.]
MKIHETTTPAGELVPVVLDRREGVLELDGAPLPPGAIEAVMKRFGAPIEPSERARLDDVEALDLGDGRRLRRARHLARFDVIARDYLVYEAPGEEPLCAMATAVAGALQHLARAARDA